MRKVLTTAAATAAVLLTVAPAGAEEAKSSVSVLHGVPDLTVDVYANGNKLLSNFAPGTLTDPQMLPAGTYNLAVYKAGDDPKSAQPAVKADGVQVPGGANITVAAHLNATGSPVLTPFVNDTSKVPAGQGRVTVRHIAAAPAVDVRAGGKVVVPGLTNPQSKSLTVPAGPLQADVVLAGTQTVAIGPADLNVKEGANTIVYAWGAADKQNLKLAVQIVGGMHSDPKSVPSGEGAAGDRTATRNLYLVGGGLAALAALGFGRRAVKARTRA